MTVYDSSCCRARWSEGISSLAVLQTTLASMSKYPWMSLFLIPTMDAHGMDGTAA